MRRGGTRTTVLQSAGDFFGHYGMQYTYIHVLLQDAVKLIRMVYVIFSLLKRLLPKSEVVAEPMANIRNDYCLIIKMLFGCLYRLVSILQSYILLNLDCNKSIFFYFCMYINSYSKLSLVEVAHAQIQ